MSEGEIRGRLEHLRDDLRATIARERDDLARPVDDPADRSGNHAAESATELFKRELEILTQRTLERELAAVDDALTRLAGGTYGICVECGGPIEPERLEVRPQAIRRAECERRFRASAPPVHLPRR